MIDAGKRNVIGINMNVVDYEGAVAKIVEAAKQRIPFGVSALAVHGVMTGFQDEEQKYRLNHLEMLTPDGQPVRGALNSLYKAGLSDRVYGPTMTLKLFEAAANEGLPVYCYGTTDEVLALLKVKLLERFPSLQIAGMEASKFRKLTPEEKQGVIERIKRSGAAITFAALGCPRQEVWAYEYKDALSMPVIAIGAAFPFIAGTLKQAPSWMQKYSLEWLFRLIAEPTRLWKRYLFLNPAYVAAVTRQKMGAKFSTEGRKPTQDLSFG